MGIPLEVLAEIVDRGSSYPDRSATGAAGQVYRLPEHAWSVVMSREPGEERHVVTVLFSTQNKYERQGRTYKVVK